MKIVKSHHLKFKQNGTGEIFNLFTQSEQVMGRDAFSLSCFGYQEQLGQDGHRLQIDTEGPQDL